MSVHVVAHISARPEAVEQVKRILQSLPAPSRLESGCLHYHLLHNKENPCDFTFIEEWQDDLAIDAHFGSPHIQAALARVPGLLAAAPDIRRYRLLD